MPLSTWSDPSKRLTCGRTTASGAASHVLVAMTPDGGRPRMQGGGVCILARTFVLKVYDDIIVRRLGSALTP